jgi:hypothetical protein
VEKRDFRAAEQLYLHNFNEIIVSKNDSDGSGLQEGI